MDPKWSAGRPRKVDRATRERIACIAWRCPRDLGWPFSTWSLSKLREVLISNGIAAISRETVRQILEAEWVSWQAVKTWKAGTDPAFSAKDEPGSGSLRPPARVRRQTEPAPAQRISGAAQSCPA
ncbi:hypothetical protein [Nocardia abscessus]|uniref:hypothetical protein n=1 Tax=Nocardia abscessus TaxID=120957 RepID=UPI003CC7D0D7